MLYAHKRPRRCLEEITSLIEDEEIGFSCLKRQAGG